MMESVRRMKGGSKAIFVLFVLAVFCFPFVSPAQNAADEAVEPDPVEAVERTIKRDPFWPVGYMPKKKEVKVAVEEVVKVDWASAEKALLINAIGSREETAYALINGQIIVVGDILKIQFKDVIYTWEVESIHPPSNVKLRQISAQ